MLVQKNNGRSTLTYFNLDTLDPTKKRMFTLNRMLSIRKQGMKKCPNASQNAVRRNLRFSCHCSEAQSKTEGPLEKLLTQPAKVFERTMASLRMWATRVNTFSLLKTRNQVLFFVLCWFFFFGDSNDTSSYLDPF